MFESDKLVKQVEALVLKRVSADQLLFPTMPAVAQRCQELLKNSEVQLKEVANLLEQEPLFAARVLRVATSAAFPQSAKRLTLLEAITRLGTKQVNTLLMDAAVSRLFLSRDPSISQNAQIVWQHSVAVGVLARDVTALVGGTDSEGAHLAGLFHDIGKPIVASILLEAERTIVENHRGRWIESPEWLTVVARTHRKVGVALAEKWQLPAEVTRCVEDSGEFDSSDRFSIHNVVCFANALAKTAGVAAPDADVEEAKALLRTGRSLFGIEDSVVEGLVNGLKAKVESLY